MALFDDLEAKVSDIFSSAWTYKNGQSVPESKNIGLGNEGTKLNATILYADLDDSTNLVDSHSAEFCAEVYKSFLHLSTKIIRSEGGEVRSFDGDRVMGVFLGDSKNSSSAKAGLKINYVVKNILNPMASKTYNNAPTVRHTVGIDTSELLAVRSGIRGSNDLVWIGRAANHAAKLNSLSADYPTRITKEVYDKLNEDSKYGGKPRRVMWSKADWTDTGRVIYRSTWHWKP